MGESERGLSSLTASSSARAEPNRREERKQDDAHGSQGRQDQDGLHGQQGQENDRRACRDQQGQGYRQGAEDEGKQRPDARGRHFPSRLAQEGQLPSHLRLLRVSLPRLASSLSLSLCVSA